MKDMETQELDFENWFGIFKDVLRKHHKYHGPIDRDEAKEYWAVGMSPEHAAYDLFSELNRQD